MKFTQKNSAGQTLVIIIFIMLIALTVGVTLSSKFITSLSSNILTQESYKAQSTAEAALERVLVYSVSELQNLIDSGNCGSLCFLQISHPDGTISEASVTLSNLGNSSDPFSVELLQNESVQVDLRGYAANRPITVCWNNPASTPLPAIVGIFIYQNTSDADGAYRVSNFAYNSFSSTVDNDFSQATGLFGYASCFSVNSQAEPYVMRLKSMYQDVDAVIIPDASTTLPTQGVLIEVEGVSASTLRRVSAIKSISSVPTMFDYVLYNKSSEQPLSN